MSEENKKLIKYLGIIFIAVLISYKLPHSSYSIIEYIIRPIRYKNSTIYLSGIVPLILYIIGIRGLFRLKRNENRSKFFIFILTVFIIIPIMKWSLGVVRTSYHLIIDDGLKAVDIADAKVSLSGNNNDITMNVNLELIDYSKSKNDFNIRVYLPEVVSNSLGKEFYELANTYSTYGNRNKSSVNEQIVIDKIDGKNYDDIFNSRWYMEPIKYELYNENQAVKIIDYGNLFR